MIAVAATDISAGGMAEPAAPPPPIKPDHKDAVHGILGMGFKCLTDDDWTVPNEKQNQTITIVVAPRLKAGTKYQVNAFPVCAGISRKGNVRFVLNTDFVDDWDSTYTVKVEFGLGGPNKSDKGPFDKVNGKPEEYGIYRDVFRKGNSVIPAGAIKDKIVKTWTGGYTVTIQDKSTQVLGEIDPGVKVIDDPGSLEKGKP